MADQDQSTFRVAAACVAVALALAAGMQVLPARGTSLETQDRVAELEAALPQTLAGYRSRPITLSDAVVDILGTERYVFREYVRPGQPTVWAWVSYYGNQRDATVHSPAGCYSGLGWTVTADEKEEAGRTLVGWPVRWLRIRRGDEERIVLYWYETRAGAVATELERNLIRLRGVLRGGTALVFVRVSTVASGDGEESREQLTEVARALRPQIVQLVEAATPEPTGVGTTELAG